MKYAHINNTRVVGKRISKAATYELKSIKPSDCHVLVSLHRLSSQSNLIRQKRAITPKPKLADCKKKYNVNRKEATGNSQHVDCLHLPQAQRTQVSVPENQFRRSRPSLNQREVDGDTGADVGAEGNVHNNNPKKQRNTTQQGAQ